MTRSEQPSTLTEDTLVEFLLTSGMDIVDSNSNDIVCNSRSTFKDCNRILNAPQIPTVYNPPVEETLDDIEKYVYKVIKGDNNKTIEAKDAFNTALINNVELHLINEKT